LILAERESKEKYQPSITDTLGQNTATLHILIIFRSLTAAHGPLTLCLFRLPAQVKRIVTFCNHLSQKNNLMMVLHTNVAVDICDWSCLDVDLLRLKEKLRRILLGDNLGDPFSQD
jgi:hypothetical protein